MLKLTYLLVFFIGASFVSCEKKTAAPTQSTTPPPVTKDTLSGRIYTVGGTGTYGYNGDGIPATAAELNGPYGVAIDASGNIYIADCSNNRVRKVNTSGIISTIVGTGSHGYSGDGGPATAAELHFPQGVAVDASGNVYISDYDNQCIRKVNTSGIISTYAGNGIAGLSGDGGPATAAEIDNPYGLAVDDSGNLYIATTDRIRKVNTKGIISTFAGSTIGYSGDGGPATSAEMYNPEGVAVDASGNVYIADYLGNRIRKVNTSGIISTYAGNGFDAGFNDGGGYSGDGGPATSAELFNPTDVVVDGSGNVYIADAGNSRIRMVNISGIISTYAGNGTSGYSGDGGPATAAKIIFPQGLGLDGSGNLYIADNNRIRKVYK